MRRFLAAVLTTIPAAKTMFGLRNAVRAQARTFATSARLAADAPKVPVALIAKLRKEIPVPMGQAREALERTNLDLPAAVAYLNSAGGASAQKKADKVAGRSTDEGTIAVSLLGGKRVAMVQLACETDFVARNEVFLKAARSIAETAAFLDVPSDHPVPSKPVGADPIEVFPTEALLSAPVITMPEDGTEPAPIGKSGEAQTVQQLLLASLAQTGENLKLQRAVSFAAPFPAKPDVRLVPGAFTHGSGDTGKIGGIVVLRVEGDADKPIAVIMAGPDGEKVDKELLTLARSVARQVVGFPTKALHPGEGVAPEEALMSQPAMMLGEQDKSVEEVIVNWGNDRGVNVQVVSMRRWSVEDELPAADDA